MADSGPDPYFVAAGAVPLRNLFPGVDIQATAGDRMMVSVVHLAPHSEVPAHSHPHEQMGYLVSGRLRFTVDEVTRDLAPGDVWRIPGGVVHRVVTLDEPAIAVDVFHPVRDDYR